jgi:hypothetical protein
VWQHYLDEAESEVTRSKSRATPRLQVDLSDRKRKTQKFREVGITSRSAGGGLTDHLPIQASSFPRRSRPQGKGRVRRLGAKDSGGIARADVADDSRRRVGCLRQV